MFPPKINIMILCKGDTGSDHRLPPRGGPPGVWADLQEGFVCLQGGVRLVSGRRTSRRGSSASKMGSAWCLGGPPGGVRLPPRWGPPGVWAGVQEGLVCLQNGVRRVSGRIT